MNGLTNELIGQFEGLKDTLDAIGGILNDPDFDPKAHQLFTNSAIEDTLASLYDSIEYGEVSNIIEQLKKI